MPEHLPSQMIELFIARKLAPADLLAAAQHLAVCDTCRAQSNQLKHTNSGIEHLHANFQEELLEHNHISYEQLTAFVDAALNQTERETVDVHLAACTTCSTEVHELELLKNNLAIYPNLALEKNASLAALQTAATANDSQLAAKPPETIWQNLLNFFQRKPFQIAFATAAVFLLAILISFFAFRSTNQTQIVQSTDSGIRLPTNSSNSPDNAASSPIGQTNKNTALPSQVQDNTSNANAQISSSNPPTGTPNANKRIEIPVSIGENAHPATLPQGYETVIKQALANQTIARPAVIAELAGKTSNLMSKKSDSESFALINPLGTVIQNDHPTFRWQGLSGATSYTIYILDSNFHVIAQSHPLSTTTWTMPQALKRGDIYVWQVTATKGGKDITAPAAPMPEARFKILEQAKAIEMQRLAKERPDSHLILGTIYAHNGLLDEAEREFQMAIDKNQDADKAKKLLQSVKALR
jgi:hypothetical protein